MNRFIWSLNIIFLVVLNSLLAVGCTSKKAEEPAGVERLAYVFQLRNLSRRPVDSASVVLYLPVQKTPYQRFLDFAIKGGSVVAVQRSDQQGNNLVEMRLADLADDYRLSLNLTARVVLTEEEGSIADQGTNAIAAQVKDGQQTPADLNVVMDSASRILATMGDGVSPRSERTMPCVSDANEFVVTALDKAIEARVMVGLAIEGDPLNATCWVELNSSAGWAAFKLQEQKLEPLEGRYIALRILDPWHEYSEKSVGELLYSSYGLDVSPVAYERAARKNAD